MRTSPRNSYPGTLGPHLVVLLGELIWPYWRNYIPRDVLWEPGSTASLFSPLHVWGWRCDLSTFCSCSLMLRHPHHYGLSIWNHKPWSTLYFALVIDLYYSNRKVADTVTQNTVFCILESLLLTHLTLSPIHFYQNFLMFLKLN